MDPRKAIVRDAYDAVATEWGKKRAATPASDRERLWIGRFLTTLPPGARVLDLGCGVGLPTLAMLAGRGCRCVGVDFSRTALQEARSHCPGAALVRADAAEVEFVPASFDAGVAFDSLWHIPHEEHFGICARVRRWLVDGATLLLTLAAAPEGNGQLFTDLLGAPIYYDARPVAESLRLLHEAGFSVVDHHLAPLSEERPSSGHLIVLAEATGPRVDAGVDPRV
jgi:cyclopropane fatty-acyl-phospholipid synthase-like methyltransferase